MLYKAGFYTLHDPSKFDVHLYDDNEHDIVCGPQSSVNLNLLRIADSLSLTCFVCLVKGAARGFDVSR